MYRGNVNHFMSARKLRKRKDGIVYLNDTDAMWQYLLDHATPHPTLGYKAIFSFRSKGSFLSSLNARKNGLYRYTQEEVDTMKPIIPKPPRIKNPSTIPMWKRRLISFIHRL